MPNQPLFTPYRMGDLDLPNRIVMAPLTRMRAQTHDHVPTALQAEYYAQRASAGLIITEATAIGAGKQLHPSHALAIVDIFPFQRAAARIEGTREEFGSVVLDTSPLPGRCPPGVDIPPTSCCLDCSRTQAPDP
jgi:NADH:flavin oxidoreductase / NADH oxidase family